MLKKIKERLKSKMAYFEFVKSCETLNYSKTELTKDEGNIEISKLLNSKAPIMISRLGSVELAVCNNYLSNCVNNQSVWNPKLLFSIKNNAGVFPNNEAIISKFASHYLESSKQIDLLGVWHNFGEDLVANHFCPRATLAPLVSLEPYYFLDKPWSKHLANKKVLVIHPFEETIKKQYQNREALFTNPDVLPPFQLITFKAVQSLGQKAEGFKTWFDALESMQDQIKNIDFDTAIIGAGAYGLPLAAYVKQLGKQAIHMGGATQILFGIKGKRWDTHPIISKLYNEHWVYPSGKDKPTNYKNVEDGCYW